VKPRPFDSVQLPLRSRRLVLRAPRRRDVPSLVHELRDREISQNLAHMPFPYRARDGYDWIRRANLGARRRDGLSLLIVRAKDATVMGGISVWPEGHDPSTLLLGYWLGREHRGYGFATEAVTKVVGTAFRAPETHRIVAYVFAHNRPSQSLLRRVGFRREGTSREAFLKNGRWLDDLQFAILRREWPLKRRR
jgi:RimJ/RimL family protein N-acetyltransferase